MLIKSMTQSKQEMAVAIIIRSEMYEQIVKKLGWDAIEQLKLRYGGRKK